MRFLDLDLEAFDYADVSHAESFSVRVARSPAGEQKIADAKRVVLPIELRSRLRLLERRGLDRAGMIAYGTLLGDALLPEGPVRAMFQTSLARAGAGCGIRLRLRFDSYALAHLPWEYLYLPADNAGGLTGFLALDRRVSITRYEVMGQPVIASTPVNGEPVRFVGTLASPATLEPLKLDRERELLQQAFAQLGGIRPEFYPKATVETLVDAMSEPAGIFHFAGHGVFEQPPGGPRYGGAEGRGSLIYHDANGGPVRVSAERLAMLLRDRGVRLAMLGACQSAQRDGVNPWSGVATSMVRAGIPAVVGMQFKILDNNALAFNRQFYRALLSGQSIDEAMHAGRLAMLMQTGDDERDWGVPVLYLRTDDATLFPGARLAPVAPVAAAQALPVAASVAYATAFTPVEADIERGEALPDLGALRGHALKVALRDVLNNRFNMADLEVLAADLGIAFDQIAGNTRLMKSLNLVEHLAHRDRLPDLLGAIRRARPGAV
jgi:CHAT domain/Effector-associated domain 7